MREDAKTQSIIQCHINSNLPFYKSYFLLGCLFNLKRLSSFSFSSQPDSLSPYSCRHLFNKPTYPDSFQLCLFYGESVHSAKAQPDPNASTIKSNARMDQISDKDLTMKPKYLKPKVSDQIHNISYIWCTLLIFSYSFALFN